jgi:hypothetical protein
MARRPLRVAALAAAALLATAGGARADEGPAPADPVTPEVEQAAPADGGIAPAGEADVPATKEAETVPAEDGASEPSVPKVAAQDPAPPAEGPGGDPPPAGSSPISKERVVVLPQPQEEAVKQTVDEAKETVGAAPAGAGAPAGPAPAPASRGSGGERSPHTQLTGLARELTALQAEIDQLEQLLDEGVTPPPTRLTRLRSRLQRLAPTLLALEATLHAGGSLSPRVRALLHRVHARLSGARVAASGLITTLRDSGLRGREARLLLDELERFRSLGAGLAAAIADRRAFSEPGAGAPYAQSPPAPTTARPHAIAPPRGAAAAPRPAAGSSPGANPDAPWHGSAASSSASVGPAGVFLLSGLASMAALIGLARAGMRTRLRLTPSRSYMALVLTPLDRPG